MARTAPIVNGWTIETDRLGGYRWYFAAAYDAAGYTIRRHRFSYRRDAVAYAEANEVPAAEAPSPELMETQARAEAVMVRFRSRCGA